MQWFFMGLDGPVRTESGCPSEALPAPRHPLVEEEVWGSREMVWLGGEDKKDGVSCRRANLTSRHIAGGTMNYENAKFKHQRSGRPLPYLTGIP